MTGELRTPTPANDFPEPCHTSLGSASRSVMLASCESRDAAMRAAAQELAVCAMNGRSMEYDSIYAILWDQMRVPFDACHRREVALRAKLEEWIRPCFCEGRAAKCLMCETRELLGQNKDYPA